MNLVNNSIAKDKHGFLLEKTIYMAILAKIKAQLHKKPTTFATFKQLMIQYYQRAKNEFWNDVQFVIESKKLKAKLESMLPQYMVEIEIIFIKQRFSQQLYRKEHMKRNILDFLNDLKASCVAKMIYYNSFMKLIRVSSQLD